MNGFGLLVLVMLSGQLNVAPYGTGPSGAGQPSAPPYSSSALPPTLPPAGSSYQLASGDAADNAQRDYGWAQDADGSLYYIIQLSPEQILQMQNTPQGELPKEKFSNMPKELVGRVRRVTVRIGTEKLPRDPSLETIARMPRLDMSDVTAALDSVGPGQIALVEPEKYQSVQGNGAAPASPYASPNSNSLLGGGSSSSRSSGAPTTQTFPPALPPQDTTTVQPPAYSGGRLDLPAGPIAGGARSSAPLPRSTANSQPPYASSNGSSAGAASKFRNAVDPSADPLANGNSRTTADKGPWSAASDPPSARMSDSRFANTATAPSGTGAVTNPYRSEPAAAQDNYQNNYQNNISGAATNRANGAGQGYAGTGFGMQPGLGQPSLAERLPGDYHNNGQLPHSSPPPQHYPQQNNAQNQVPFYGPPPAHYTAGAPQNGPVANGSFAANQIRDDTTHVAANQAAGQRSGTGSPMGSASEQDQSASDAELERRAKENQQQAQSGVLQVFFLLSLVVNIYLGTLIRKLLSRYRNLLTSVRGQVA